MLAAVPRLRAFAISLSGKVDRADDLVQETLLLAMVNIHSFQPGTNMPAWLLTILRNRYRTEYRKYRREIEDVDGGYAKSLISPPEQHSRMELAEFRVALATLPPNQREALLLVGASGFSCEEAAAISDCAVGTIKSRVNRARTRLASAAVHRQRPQVRARDLVGEAWRHGGDKGTRVEIETRAQRIVMTVTVWIGPSSRRGPGYRCAHPGYALFQPGTGLAENSL